MVIERRSPWWRGSVGSDLAEFLMAFTYGQVSEIVPARCDGCGDSVFVVGIDDEHGYAVRRCAGCDRPWVMLGGTSWAEVERAVCPCGGELFEVAAGFTERLDGELGWVYLALRCTTDDVLGLYGDWRITTHPTRKLLDLV
jgi:hypothetical protein